MENNLYFLLNTAQQTLFRQVDQQALQLVGVSAAQITALHHLQSMNGCMQADLGDALGLGKAATSGMVSRLEKNGLVKRLPSPTDGRGYKLMLTEDGEKAIVRSRPLLNQLNVILEDGFKESELVVIRRFMHTVVDKLTAE
ncbi:MarR family winged helix-turn-helix transcriptional regulator [Parendozoicomonas haliclonae]|uniref:DNA-binding transcriptional repressor MarR n=1 Tax=Parendozoicomonas haliclonae TaxID=1960125 RepID=A0A1X7AN67_9GAMM|nr:MarR family winged helix-turn-helix transcriptional regulator [Parendozoicomonas haliclonae]SMA49556.1 DNA-binding transcriptional repressor MarR [Parendozoicomonas haliclonae]